MRVALAYGACAAAIAYAASRAVQVAFFPDPDPRTVIMVARIGFFWRVLIALYAALIATVGAAALHARVPQAMERRLFDVVAWTAAISTLQGVLLP